MLDQLDARVTHGDSTVIPDVLLGWYSPGGRMNGCEDLVEALRRAAAAQQA